ncbi:glutamate receptor ionotropic, delta-2-like [Zootermopsis nevadensis]|uniref:glutamate receptor ionotropic, delta-2-like n=1 Tax=Zootermopsis nevadensis TaxID=136037 RepID=UPI000B8E94C5|nr:glutamate receptor ionotropic, delta-2-like [Zootermopsis nevadensis]
MDSATMTFIGDISKASPPAVVGAFVCCKSGDILRLWRHLSDQHVLLTTQTTIQGAETLLQTTERDRQMTFIVDMACQDSRAILHKAHVLNLFDERRRWILLGNQTRTQDVLEDLNILLYSDVVVAERVSDGTVLLVEMYKRRSYETLIKTVIGDWSQGRGVRLTSSPVKFSRRADLQKSVLQAVMVVTNNNSLLHLKDTTDRHIDTISKLNYAIFCHVADIVNARVEMTVVGTWGYDVNGSWTGLSGYLQRGDADIGATALFVTKNRLPFMTYIAGTTDSESGFLFRQPPLSFVANIFTLPFSRNVWLTSVGFITVAGFLLHGTINWENRQVTWSDMVLFAVGAVCQQGSTMEAKGLSGRIITIFLFTTEAKGLPGRIITIFLFVAVIFLYTSYSASIVVLLQSSTTSIRTLHDLLDSDLSLGAHDIVYNRYYFKAVSDPIRHAIYTRKVNPPAGPENFLPLEDGIKRIRTSRFAFHMELGPGYKYIWDTFLEEDKCNLQRITFLTEIPKPFVAVSKKTPFKEILTIGYRKVHERGLQQRENLRFYHAKPECASRGSNFVSVGIVDCYSALLVLVYGMLLSLVLLLAEIVVRQTRDAGNSLSRAQRNFYSN